MKPYRIDLRRRYTDGVWTGAYLGLAMFSLLSTAWFAAAVGLVLGGFHHFACRKLYKTEDVVLKAIADATDPAKDPA